MATREESGYLYGAGCQERKSENIVMGSSILIIMHFIVTAS